MACLSAKAGASNREQRHRDPGVRHAAASRSGRGRRAPVPQEVANMRPSVLDFAGAEPPAETGDSGRGRCLPGVRTAQ
jgi:hypothetical protein